MAMTNTTLGSGRYEARRLFDLLPQIYRIRDAQLATDGQPGPLEALIAVLAREADVVEADIARLYDNWFIETCDAWVVPYIADLLGVRGLARVSPEGASMRARVANTLAYRRRKGTATMLEQLARDTTGWPAHAVEFFQRLATTQYLNHLRPENLRTPDLRDGNALELAHGPFESANHTADVRRIAVGRGRYNIANIGLFLWRLAAYPLVEASATAASSPADGRYRFDCLGADTPLWNVPQTERRITQLAGERNVPAPLRRRPLYDELEARRQAITDQRDPTVAYFTGDPPFKVHVRENAGDADCVAVPPESVLICDLSDLASLPGEWRRPPTKKTYTATRPTVTPQTRDFDKLVAVDPVLGRIAFPAGVTPAEVRVSYAYGFSGDLGGGPYNRREAVEGHFRKDRQDAANRDLRQVTWRAGVSKKFPAVAAEPVFDSLEKAVAAWNALPAAKREVGFITVMDSLSYREDLTGSAHTIKVPAGSLLVITAAEWPVVTDAGGAQSRPDALWSADQVRPHVRGDWEITGGKAGPNQVGGEIVIDGLLIEGKVSVVSNAQKGKLGSLTLSHCTLLPGKGGVSVAPSIDSVRLSISRSISAQVDCNAESAEIAIAESIVDAPAGTAVSAKKSHISVSHSTLLGGVEARTFDADTAILDGKVEVERRQTGCARFCYVPDDSHTPRRYRCQPDLALKDVPPAQKAAVRARVVPQFTSAKYGEGAYCQLARQCCAEIARGAEDGDEMGAFHFLQGAARETALAASLDEYLRFGLEAGIIFVT